MNGMKDSGKLYALPTTNYKMGLIYNRKLFQQAGLDPDNPPTTWEDIAAAAKKITALGTGHHRLRRVQRAATPAAGTSPRRCTAWAADGHRRRQEGRVQRRQRQARPPAPATTCAGRTRQHGRHPGLPLAGPDEEHGVRQGGHVPRRARRHHLHGPVAGRQLQRLRHGPDARRQGHAERRQRLLLQEGPQRRPDQGRHRLGQLQVPDPGQGPVRLRPHQGRRPPGRPAPAAVLDRRGQRPGHRRQDGQRDHAGGQLQAVHGDARRR